MGAKARERAGKGFEKRRERLEQIFDGYKGKEKRGLMTLMDIILWQPLLTVILVSIISVYFFYQSQDLNVTGESRVFLPEGEEASA